jgi:twitching motility two-component system response regulator PilH
MSRILLADDSTHAQRMGERILREEGFEVVSLTDGATVLKRLEDVDPDVLLADVFLPNQNGYDLCRFVKTHPRHRHVRVVLTAGLLEPLDEEEARRAGADAVLKKPFEASVVMDTIRPLSVEAELARGLFGDAIAAEQKTPEPAVSKPAPVMTEVDPERVKAAITIALDRALPALVEEITERVLVALGH